MTHHHSHYITGKIIPGPARSIEYPRIGPNSRLTVQLLDVSLMDAPSVTLGEQVFTTGVNQNLDFPITFKIPYDSHKVNKHGHQSLSISARVEEGDQLAWISTMRYSVLTNGNPSENVEVAIERVYTPDEGSLPVPSDPASRTSSLTGRIVAGQNKDGKIGPKNRVLVQLLDVSLMDVAAVTVAEQVLESGEEGLEFPVAFTLMYDPSKIEDYRTYSVSVRVEKEGDSGDLIWLSTYQNGVLTRGGPSDGVEVEIEQI
ncbi:hypothetical protein BGZ83_010997 [Gryganskiella cystojenkinii]|nr:hypothetical protein BGZ83_010997 [Gryganskiella cystojenkinii]